MSIETRVEALLAAMTPEEKLGQMQQMHGGAEEHKALLRRGAVGSILNIFPAEAEQPGTPGQRISGGGRQRVTAGHPAASSGAM